MFLLVCSSTTASKSDKTAISSDKTKDIDKTYLGGCFGDQFVNSFIFFELLQKAQILIWCLNSQTTSKPMAFTYKTVMNKQMS